MDRAFLFFPWHIDYLRLFIRRPMFNCPTVAVPTQSPEAFFAEIDDVARDLFQLLPNSKGPLNFFGFCGGAIMASLAAGVAVAAGHDVRLLLANPWIQWWPRPKTNDKYQAYYDELEARAKADPVYRTRLEARGEILASLPCSVQQGLRMKIFASEYSSGDIGRAERIASITKCDIVRLQTADHEIVYWLHRAFHEDARLYEVLSERFRRRRPEADCAAIEALARAEMAGMREYWSRHSDLQTIAATL